jgi:Protein of unknown function (DUF1194)
MLSAPRSFADRTSISAAIDFSIAHFARSSFKADRRVINISGDGTNNSGRNVTAARDEAMAQGVTINGIAILSEEPKPFFPNTFARRTSCLLPEQCDWRPWWIRDSGSKFRGIRTGFNQQADQGGCDWAGTHPIGAFRRHIQFIYWLT